MRIFADKKLLTDAMMAEPGGARQQGNKITYDGGDPKKRVRGFGVRVTASGARAFILNYRAGGTERRYTIGSFPDWSVSTAREEAKRLRREIDRGEDRARRGRRDYREAPTVADLCVRYIEEHASARKRERSRLEGRGPHQTVGQARARYTEGGRDQCRRPRKAASKNHPAHYQNEGKSRRHAAVADVLARGALGVAGRQSRFWVERNHEEPRQRYLSGDELRRLTEALAAHPNQAAANAILLLLLTGARRPQALAATWHQFDLEAGIWGKPSSHTKQNKEHRVPLSAPARSGSLLKSGTASVAEGPIESCCRSHLRRRRLPRRAKGT